MSTRFGRYLLIEPLGAGGMAEVWRARMEGARGFSRDLVIKRIRTAMMADNGFAELFAREARLSARLHHANIVQVFEYGEVDGEPYLAMEFVEGLDLSRLMRAHASGLPSGLAAFVVREIAGALQCVHEATGENGEPLGLVHRDVSPSNVMLAVDGSVKLFDFGIARASSEVSLTDQGSFRGKLSYTAPEVVEGQPHDARSDLFGLGVVLHELITGKRLFTGANDAQVLQRVHTAQVPPLSTMVPEVPPALELVCSRLLARLPGDRYESARELVEAIDRVVLELQMGPRQLAALVTELRARTPATTQRAELQKQVLTRAVGPEVPIEFTPPQPQPKPKRSRALAGWLGLGLGALVLGVVGASWPRHAPAPVASRAVEVAPSAVAPAALPTVPPAPIDAGARLDDPMDAGPRPAPSVVVRSVPAGAQVKTSLGQVLGNTPVAVSAPFPARLIVTRAGFQPEAVKLDGKRETVDVVLRRVPGQAKAPPQVDLKAGQVVDPFTK